MIKHSIKDNVIYVAIANMDFSYRIPVSKIGNTIDWRIGGKGGKGIVIKDVSAWTLQLFTNKITEYKYIKQFKSIVQKHCPDCSINWEETLLAVNIQNEYNWLITTNSATGEKLSESKVISFLKTKYKVS